MSDKLQKLELTWPGKEDRFHPEPRILLEDTAKSYSKPAVKTDLLGQGVEPTFDNMLIHGDNLLALKALEQDFTGKIKCIYIDPPYNTGNAFEYYDDGLEHSIWLSLMRDRLEILKRLLSEDGSIWIQIDDEEQAYLKVLCDEIFGRQNFINMISVNMKNNAGASGGGEDKRLKKNCEFILVYAKDYSSIYQFKNAYDYTEIYDVITDYRKKGKNWHYTSVLYDKGEKIYMGSVVDGDGNEIKIFKREKCVIKSIKQIMDEQKITEQEAYYQYGDYIFEAKDAQSSIRTRVGKARKELKIESDVISIEYIPKTGRNRGQIYEQFYKGDKVRLFAWLKDISEKRDGVLYKKDLQGTYWDFTSSINNLTKEGGVIFPKGKKPEALIYRIFSMATEENDLVLDSFLGSGTTAAVAQKMGRRWIGVEMGEHINTHCIPRLQKVINGEDLGGITKTVNWQGGGGFKFYELAASLIVKDKYGQQIISDKYNAEMLAEAMCKILGYHYKPDPEKYWKQGFSSEKSFIYTTTMSMQEEALSKLADDVGDDNLLICCSAFIGNPKAYPNISVKKIPAAILKKCEWGMEGYPLNISTYHPTDEDFEFEEEA